MRPSQKRIIIQITVECLRTIHFSPFYFGTYGAQYVGHRFYMQFSPGVGMEVGLKEDLQHARELNGLVVFVLKRENIGQILVSRLIFMESEELANSGEERRISRPHWENGSK